MKKTMALLLALIMVFALAVPAMAAGEGSITINNAVVGQTYTIYRVFDLESYNAQTNAYAYKINNTWKAFAQTADAKAYIDLDDQSYVTWVGEATDARAAEFARLALAYAKEHEIAKVGSEKADADTVTFTGLPLGYYLIDTTTGTLCALNTTNPTVNVEEKNTEPTVDKEVKENSTNQFGKNNDANIGDTIEFRATITAGKGAENYVLHDKMSEGLEFNKDSVNVTLNGATVAADKYTVVANPSDGCTFDVQFAKKFCESLNTGDNVVVTYTATLTEDAVVADPNKNETHISYGENGDLKSQPSETKTYTWKVDILKYTGKNKTPLADAEFKLQRVSDEKWATVANGKITGWVAEETEATTLKSDANGMITIKGLDSGAYLLHETKAPAGYNKLKDPVAFTITANLSVGSSTLTYTGKTAPISQIEVENLTGSALPSTGGIGTTIFYVVGGLLMLGAVVVLVTRKKVHASK